MATLAEIAAVYTWVPDVYIQEVTNPMALADDEKPKYLRWSKPAFYADRYRAKYEFFGKVRLSYVPKSVIAMIKNDSSVLDPFGGKFYWDVVQVERPTWFASSVVTITNAMAVPHFIPRSASLDAPFFARVLLVPSDLAAVTDTDLADMDKDAGGV